MRPWVSRAENQRMATLSKASNNATPATAIASPMTIPARRGRMPLSMICRSSNGLATVITASTQVATRNTASCHRYGRA
jgi:hypothetical protein